jgi:hypothetical protein
VTRKACTLLLPFLTVLFFSIPGCGLFGPREPEPPTQSGLNNRPPTEPSIVIANLQSAIDQKNIVNYMGCFTDPSKGGMPFVFIPSADAGALYAGVLSTWSYRDEEAYFQNLIARSPAQAFSSLSLTLKTSTVSADSVVYSYDYVLVFEHTDPAFPRTARGALQFTVRVDNNNFWMIQRWVDFTTTSDISWSHFKGNFSN